MKGAARSRREDQRTPRRPATPAAPAVEQDPIERPDGNTTLFCADDSEKTEVYTC